MYVCMCGPCFLHVFVGSCCDGPLDALCLLGSLMFSFPSSQPFWKFKFFFFGCLFYVSHNYTFKTGMSHFSRRGRGE
ncbi:hypothetical protein F5B17DRAFT_375885 [Nemania serpens]|nr:hypothetical protein F5B17DRAFT_375885 [Nemania serpens]